MTLWCFLLASIACSTDAIPTAPSGPEQNRLVASVSIAPGDLVIAPDETFQLSPVVKSARGRVVNGRTVTWSSSDESVVRIDRLGNIVAGHEGTATIRANVEGVTGTATVDVRGEVVQIEIDAPARAFAEGGTQQLSATYIYRNGARRAAGKLFWRSSDPGRLVVDGDGLLRGLRPGDVRVNGQGRGKSSTLELTVEDTEEETVTVSADEIEMTVGDSVQLWADVLNSNGDRLSRKVKWSSSDPAVASVDDEGLVKALSAGSATVYAKSGNVSDSTLVTVVEGTTSSDSDGSTSDGTSDDGDTDDGSTTTSTESTSLPGTVSNLAVKTSYTTYNSVTLTFTEVDDGTGQPADYDVRYIESPMDGQWGSASSVTKGTCATPLQGTSIGATMTCSVEGLQASTSYDFQLVAYRGTLNEDAVFGELSNVATEVTADAPIVVDVVPSSFEIEVEQTKQLEASVTDVYGNPVDATVSWSTSSSYVATVDNSGLVSGQEAGDATITASAEGDSDSSDATVTSTESTTSSSDDGGSTSTTSGEGGAHEPSSFTKITERGFSAFDEDGWSDQRNSNLSLVDGALQQRHPGAEDWDDCSATGGGWEGGKGGSTSQGTFADKKALYLHVWVKLSSNFEGHGSGVNKYIFIRGNGGGAEVAYILFRGVDSGTLKVNMNAQGQYNDNMSSAAVSRDQWVEIEAIFVQNSAIDVADGEYHQWVNGVKTSEHFDVLYAINTNKDHFDAVRINPTWGGVGDCLTHNQFIWTDHIYVSGQ